NRAKSSTSIRSLCANNWSSVRYHSWSQFKSTRTRPCCFQRARILLPSRPQTKSLSSHCANACSLLGRQSRFATSTSTRSAKGSLPVFCTRFLFGAKPSRMFSRPSSRHSQRATSIGPQQAARVASMRSVQVAELPLVLLPPPKSSMRLSRCGARRSLRPKLAMTRCLEWPFSQYASTKRMYSNSTPSAPLALTVRRYIICHDQNAEQLPDKSRFNLHYKTKLQKNTHYICH